jgi:RNA polymerase sigma factor for flagellar operon FliA
VNEALASSTPPRRALSRADYERFLPMVRRIAMRVARRVPSYITVGDLMGAGWVGLVEVFSRADPGMPPDELEAYMSHRVRGAMLDHLRSFDPTARQLRNASRRVARAIAAQRQALGRPPEEEEIAGALGLTLEGYRSLLGSVAAAGMARLELVDFDDTNAADDTHDDPEEEADKHMLGELIAGAIDELPERQQQILALYYQEDCTLKEIGAIFNVTESRISQIHTEAMHRLRAAIGRE